MEYRRNLGLFQSAMVVVGGTVAVGIFVNPAVAAQRVTTAAEFLLVWLLGGVIALVGGLCYAELGTRIPRAGGNFVYLQSTLGDLPAFLFGWTLLLVIGSGVAAVVAIVLGRHVADLLHIDPEWAPAVGAGCIALLSLVNFFGIRPGAITNSCLTIIKLATLGLLILGGWVHLTFDPTPTAAGDLGPMIGAGNPSRLLTAVLPVLFTCSGWQNLGYIAGEVRDPRRNFPRAIAFGMTLVLVVYFFFNLVLVRVLTLPILQESTTPASELGAVILGSQGRTLVSVAIAVSALGYLTVILMAVPRVYHSMAEAGLFFSSCSRLHPVYRTPGAAILIQAAWTVFLAVTGSYAQLLDYTVLGAWLFGALTVSALFVLRTRARGVTSRAVFLVPGYPWLPLAFVCVSLAIASGAIVSNPRSGLMGLGLILLGVPIYLLWRARAS